MKLKKEKQAIKELNDHSSGDRSSDSNIKEDKSDDLGSDTSP